MHQRRAYQQQAWYETGQQRRIYSDPLLRLAVRGPRPIFFPSSAYSPEHRYLFLVSIKPIRAGDELLVDYSKPYWKTQETFMLEMGDILHPRHDDSSSDDDV